MPDDEQKYLRKLASLGFALTEPAGAEWVVREFQGYSRNAKRFALVEHEGDSLEHWTPFDPRTTTPDREAYVYSGEVTGVLDAATKTVIDNWEKKRLRCPVVLEAWRVRGEQRDAKRKPLGRTVTNLWNPSGPDTAVRVFALDFSQDPKEADLSDSGSPFSRLPGEGRDRILVGSAYEWGDGTGPAALAARHAFRHFSPEALDPDWEKWSEARRSAFRVAYASSLPEIEGYLDSFNAYDGEYLSLGPCQWTARGKELGALLALFKLNYSAAYQRVFSDWGLGYFGPLHKNSGAQRTANIGVRRADGWHELTADESSYLRSWHLVYRLQKAVRSEVLYRRAMFDLTRVRANDIAPLRFPSGVALPAIPGMTARPQLIEVFASELTLALLVRWHIKYPSDVISNNAWGAALVDILRAFAATSPPPLKNWGPAQQRKLADLIAATATNDTYGRDDLEHAFKIVRNASMPHPLGCGIEALLEAPGSAQLDKLNLPPEFQVGPAEAKEQEPYPTESHALPARIRVLAFLNDDGTSNTIETELQGGRFYVDGAQLHAGTPRTFANARRLVIYDSNGNQTPLASIPLLKGGNRPTSVGVDNDVLSDLQVLFQLPSLLADPESGRYDLNFAVVLDQVRIRRSFLHGKPLTRDTLREIAQWDLSTPRPVLWLSPAAEVTGLGHAGFVDNPRANGAPAGTAAALLPQLLLQIVADVRFPHTSAWRPNSDAPQLEWLVDVPGLGIDFPSDTPATRSMRVHQRQPFDQPAETTGGGTSWLIETQLSDAEALGCWNRMVATPTSLSLARVAPGRSATFMPELISTAAPDATSGTWAARSWVVDRRDATSVNGPVRWSVPRAVLDVPSGQVAWWPREVVREQSEKLNVPAAFAGLRSHEGTAVRALLVLERCFHETSADAKWSELDPTQGNLGFHFSLRPSKLPQHGAAKVRMGALTLSIADQAPFAAQDEARHVEARHRGEPNPSTPVVDYRLELDLAVVGFAPHGQDDVPGAEYDDASRRSDSLVFPLDDRAASEVQLLLSIDEVVTAQTSQDISLTLRPGSTGGFALDGRELLVLDPAPFFVGAVKSNQRAVDLGLANVLATWSNRANLGAGWELRFGGADFELKLPPQGIGEEMERSADDLDLSEGRPADFRFTPPTTLVLSTDTVAKRLNDPPWNLRRILGYPGQRDPGAALAAVDFEILYGMRGKLAPKGNLRLAEVGARLGGLPVVVAAGPASLTGSPAEQAVALEQGVWAAVRPTLESRLAVLEPWALGTPEPIFDENSGLSFELRKDVHFRDPVRAGAAPGKVTWDPQGLAGSFPWAFESRNLIEALYRERRSITATLANLRFSALGAWATQSATFDEGRVRISATFTMGRLHRLTVEHVGRLSVYFVPMRHVIVYERSVVASRQFYQQQESFAGVAALRKTEEYLEPMEAEHIFKDGPALDRGPLFGVRFGGQPPRIAVDSRWGRDVTDLGWRIPLWNPTATPKDVYPRPDVRLLLAGADADEPVEQPFEVPENLTFFTSTVKGWGDHPSSWPAIEEVDFRLGALPERPPAEGDLPESYGKEAIEPATPAALGSFTHALRAGTAPTNLTAHRSSEIIRAELLNVSPMRSAPSPKELQARSLLPDLGALLGNALAAARAQIVRDAKLTDIFPNIRQAATDALQQVLLVGLKLVPAPTDVTFVINQLAAYQKAYDSQERSRAIDEILRAAAAEALTLAVTLKPVGAMTADAPIGHEKAQELRDAITANFGTAQTQGTVAYRLHTMPGAPGEVRRLADQSHDSLARTVARVKDTAACTREWMRNFTTEDLRNEENRARLAEVGDELLEATREIESAAGTPFRPISGGAFDSVRFAILEKRERVDVDSARLGWIAEPQVLDELLGGKTALHADGDTESVVGRIEELAEIAHCKLTEAVHSIGEDWTPRSVGTLLTGLLLGVQETDTWAELEQNLVTATQSFAAGSAGLVADDLATMAVALATAARTCFAQVTSGATGQLLLWARNLAEKKILPWQFADWETVWTARLHANLGAAAFRVELDRLHARLADTCAALLAPHQLELATLETVANSALQLVRAFGHPPQVPNLGFTRDTVGYYFLDAARKVLPHVQLGPIAGRVNDLANGLNGINIHLPIDRLQDWMEPVSLDKFDLSKIFPSFAGLSLSGLFDGLKFEKLSGTNVDDRIKVTHGMDVATRSAWVQADVDASFEREVKLIDQGPVRVTLGRARFTATCRMETQGHTPRMLTRGQLAGTWRISLKDTHIVSLVDTTLRFENDGKIHFDISPERVQLAEVLKFLTDLLGSVSTGNGGFSVAVAPMGITTRLDLALPPVQGAVFGITNLSLGFKLGLSLDLVANPKQFRLRSALSVARADAPFTITVFILGGAGYFESWFDYSFELGTGKRLALQAGMALAIYASASLAISLGPISGGVYVYFGIEARFKTGAETSFSLAIRLVMRGELSLLGLAQACLTITLEAVYESGGGFVGRGQVRVQLKICWFLNIDITVEAEYRFGKPATRSALRAPAPSIFGDDVYDAIADSYVRMFG